MKPRKITRAMKKLYTTEHNNHCNINDGDMNDTATRSDRSSGNGQAPDGVCTAPPGISKETCLNTREATSALRPTPADIVAGSYIMNGLCSSADNR